MQAPFYMLTINDRLHRSFSSKNLKHSRQYRYVNQTRMYEADSDR